MPNGGMDNCGMCDYGSPLGQRVHCRIRDIDIDDPNWTYCANNQVTNPDGIETPAGPVCVDDPDSYPYRRVFLLPSPDGFVNERLDLLGRAVSGELDPRTRRIQVGLIDDLARQGTGAAVPHLVDLALAEPGGLNPAGFAGPDAEMFDMSYSWETDAVRIEFVRLAALRALRKIEYAVSDVDVLAELNRRMQGADQEMLYRINVAVAFVLDTQDPP